jgi:hypothetical protein
MHMVKVGWPWRAAAAVALVLVLGIAAAVTLVYHGRPQPLSLAATHPRTPAPTSDVNDPLAAVCRKPAVFPAASAAASAAGDLSGLWLTQAGSVVGYRAHEKFDELPSPHEAVARTERVSGWLLVAADGGATRIVTGCVAVEIGTLVSVDELPGFNTSDRDKSTRDFLHAREHPYAVFQPYPQSISVLSSGAPSHARVAGDLEVNGVRKAATFALDVQLKDHQIAAAGNTTIAVGDFGVEVPQGAAGFVSVDPHITLEASLILSRP